MLTYDQTKAIVEDEAKKKGFTLEYFEQRSPIGSGRTITDFHLRGPHGALLDGGGEYVCLSEGEARIAVRLCVRYGSPVDEPTPMIDTYRASE